MAGKKAPAPSDAGLMVNLAGGHSWRVPAYPYRPGDRAAPQRECGRHITPQTTLGLPSIQSSEKARLAGKKSSQAAGADVRRDPFIGARMVQRAPMPASADNGGRFLDQGKSIAEKGGSSKATHRAKRYFALYSPPTVARSGPSDGLAPTCGRRWLAPRHHGWRREPAQALVGRGRRG